MLRDSFSVYQQPPIWEPPSHYSMAQNVQPAAPAGRQQVTGLRQRIITSLHKNHSTFISVSTIFIIRPRSLYNQIYLLLFWSRVTILHLRSFIHCQCWQESNERMHSSTTWPRLNAVVMKRFQDAAGGGLSLVTLHQSPLLFTIIKCGLWQGFTDASLRCSGDRWEDDTPVCSSHQSDLIILCRNTDPKLCEVIFIADIQKLFHFLWYTRVALDDSVILYLLSYNYPLAN